ncbi:homoserine dehydrogenase [Sphingopyxis terrae subsp. terrae NBRC 15098]|uniref:Homoserine dehydrogenase n=1 Tax=Sphingopyxis terrae subsp. terrae NBRC 15098 TaxID=1219058 RepID=A0A142VZ71_9SPHN|nr:MULTISPECIES: homoserine dehydrogenase [Sphingopyxis]AMU94575.1 homoserine dehydrogenase [Sphingopyxis terrae subsp. terrae NBRC 15098]QXF13821.1 homoserine dehydrogenase [Sphingopyxis terrae subsp. terrae]
MSPQPAPATPRPPLRVALAGIGVVGGGVVRLLEANRALIARRAGRAVEIVAVSARDRQKDRGVDLSPYRWEDDMAALVESDDVDVVVEMVGGADGPALTLARQALGAGKALVTANKAMIAHHGLDLAQIAEAQDTPLKYEAAVAGGIPVIKAIREGASANQIARVYGILNGTCNYILTLMEREGASFADALAAAQAEGYAEADPTFDVDGIDAAHKLSILAALCFGTRLDIDTVTAEGIRGLIAADIREAAALGHRVRLIGMAERDEGGLYQHVQPCLVPADHPLAYVPGALNAVVAEGNFVGRLFFEGAGAGAGPTASAIVADIIDIARDEYGPAFAMPVDALDAAPAADAGARVGKHYVRLIVEDRIGVLAEIATAMRDAGVSIESFIQRGDDAEGGVLIALVTHEGPGRAVAAALAALAASDHVIGTPMHMPILAL